MTLLVSKVLDIGHYINVNNVMDVTDIETVKKKIIWFCVIVIKVQILIQIKEKGTVICKVKRYSHIL